MTTQNPTSSTATESNTLGRLVIGTACGAIALAAAWLGYGQLHSHPASRAALVAATSAPVASRAGPALAQPAPPAGGATTTAATTSSTRPTTHILVVASTADAARTEGATVQELNAMLAPSGAPPAAVVVLPPSEDLWPALHSMDAFLAPTGSGLLTPLTLPTDGSTAVSAHFPDAAPAPAPALLLVGSRTQRAAAQQMLDAAAAGTGQAGLSPAYDTVVEAGPGVGAADVLVAFGFENEQRAAHGLPPITVQDLR